MLKGPKGEKRPADAVGAAVMAEDAKDGGRRRPLSGLLMDQLAERVPRKGGS